MQTNSFPTSSQDNYGCPYLQIPPLLQSQNESISPPSHMPHAQHHNINHYIIHHRCHIIFPILVIASSFLDATSISTPTYCICPRNINISILRTCFTNQHNKIHNVHHKFNRLFITRLKNVPLLYHKPPIGPKSIFYA